MRQLNLLLAKAGAATPALVAATAPAPIAADFIKLRLPWSIVFSCMN